MYPILWTMGPVEIRAYGFMLAISFVVGIALALRRARTAGLDTLMVSNACLLILFSSIIGSRLLYIWENPSSYQGRAYRVLSIWEGGLSMLGGVILAIAATMIYVRAKGASFRRVGDALVPSLALGLVLTRIGCFLNGCCFGEVCELPWAVVFPAGSAAGHQFPDVAIHPTQLYSALSGLGILGVLLAADKRGKPPGHLFGLFFVLYGICRFLLEFVRYHEPGIVAFTVSDLTITTYQIMCVVLFSVGAYFLLTARPVPTYAPSR